MPQFMIFDLFHTLVHGADDERDRVVAQMGGIVGIEPAALVRAYHDTWRERLIQWDAEQTDLGGAARRLPVGGASGAGRCAPP
jgi:putative hydrolase of the HAD superfamily